MAFRIPLVRAVAMSRPLLLAALSLALTVSVALAGGLSLNWGTVCYTETPVSLRTFACDTNSGAAAVMTTSFALDSTMSDLVGVEWTIEGESDSPALPDWWQLGVAPDCRAGRASFNSNYTGVESEACADWTGGAGFDAHGYTWSGNRVTLTMGTAIDGSTPFTAVAGQEYYAGGVTILNRQTVGTGACTGCQVGMRFGLSTLSVAGLGGRRDVLTVRMPGGNQFLRWNTHDPTVPTATVVSTSPNPSLLGNAATLTATVTPGSATGKVTFSDAMHAFGVASLSGGVATLTTTSLAEGEHTFTAEYDGDFDRYGSASPVATHTVLHRDPSSVALTASPDTSMVGHPVLLTATVSPSGAGGSVEFRDGGVSLGTRVLASGVATLTTSSLALGDRALSATYGGDNTYLASQSAVVSHTVSARLPTTVTVTVSPSPSFLGRSVLITATLSPRAASGMVTFYETDPRGYYGIIGTGQVVLHDGVATVATAFNEEGRWSFRVTYGGDSTYAASQSSVVYLTVNPPIPPSPTTTELTASPNPLVMGDSLHLVAAVTPATATGSVVFHDGSVSLGTAHLTVGVATLVVPGLCGGSHALSAVYSGDADYLGSTSPGINQFVQPGAPTTVALASSLNPSVSMYAVTFTAHVIDPAAHPCAVSGTVRFVIDDTVYGDAAVDSNGMATTGGIVSLACGIHDVHAVYSGNASFLGSTSASITQEVLCNFEPALLSVRDVPNDQGGHVNLIWNASCLDRLPFGEIESYWILRSAPSAPGARARQVGAVVTSAVTDTLHERGGTFRAVGRQEVAYNWEHIASQPATHAATYSCVAQTTCDSVAGVNPITAFRIEVRKVGGREEWFSDPDSGYSVDNLAPAAPQGFVAGHWAGSTNLSWSPVDVPDVAGYRIHRGVGADFVPGPENLIASTLLAGYEDVVEELFCYALCAVDVHGNVGPFSRTQAYASTGTPQDGSFSFALEGVRPNPTTERAFKVQFVLPHGSPARLALYDLGGRCVAFREVGSLGPGRHLVDLGEGARFAPGVYVVRLTQGAMTRAVRAVVLR